jgi:hypothetical protein
MLKHEKALVLAQMCYNAVISHIIVNYLGADNGQANDDRAQTVCGGRKPPAGHA